METIPTTCWMEKLLKEAPIYFSNIFISFLGLAYFTPVFRVPCSVFRVVSDRLL